MPRNNREEVDNNNNNNNNKKNNPTKRINPTTNPSYPYNNNHTHPLPNPHRNQSKPNQYTSNTIPKYPPNPQTLSPSPPKKPKKTKKAKKKKKREPLKPGGTGNRTITHDTLASSSSSSSLGYRILFVQKRARTYPRLARPQRDVIPLDHTTLLLCGGLMVD